MEEEDGFPSLLPHSVHQQDAWPSVDPPLLNGQEEKVDMWVRMEVQIRPTHEMELNPPPKVGVQSREEAAQRLEQMLCPMYRMTCTSSSFSCATVQWDTTEASAEAHQPLTGSSSANEPDFGRMTNLDATPLSLHPSKDADAEFFSQRDAEEQGRPDLLLPPCSSPKGCQSGSQTRDAADAQRPTSHIEDAHRREPLNHNDDISPWADLEDQKEHLVSEEVVEKVDRLSSEDYFEIVAEEEHLVPPDNRETVEEEQQLLSGTAEEGQLVSESVEEEQLVSGTVEEEQFVSQDNGKTVKKEEQLVSDTVEEGEQLVFFRDIAEIEEEEEQLISENTAGLAQREEQEFAKDGAETLEVGEKLLFVDDTQTEEEEEQLVSEDCVEPTEEEEPLVSEDCVKPIDEEDQLVEEDFVNAVEAEGQCVCGDNTETGTAEELLRDDDEDASGQDQIVSGGFVPTAEEGEQLPDCVDIETEDEKSKLENFVEVEEQFVCENNVEAVDVEGQSVSEDKAEIVEGQEPLQDRVESVTKEEQSGDFTETLTVEGTISEGALETLARIQAAEETEGSAGGDLEAEQEIWSVVLTGQTESGDEEPAAANGPDAVSAERGDCRKGRTATPASCSEGGVPGLSCDAEFPQELLQRVETGLTTNSDQLIQAQQGGHSEGRTCSTGQETAPLHPYTCPAEEPAMFKDVEVNVCPEQSHASHKEQEVEGAEYAKRSSGFQETEEETQPLQNVKCLEQLWKLDCGQPPQDNKRGSDSEQRQTFAECVKIRQLLQVEVQFSEEQSGQPQHLEQLPLALPTEAEEELGDPGHPAEPELERLVSTGESPQMEPSDEKERPPQTAGSLPNSSPRFEQSDDFKVTEQLFPVAEVAQTKAETETSEEDKQTEASDQTHSSSSTWDGSSQTLAANGEVGESAEPHVNGSVADREMACRLAERLQTLDGIQRADVVKHFYKDNDFSRAVGEEYLNFFDFSGQTLDQALRSFLKVVVLIGETQERERVLQHFANRFHQCNPDSFSSAGAVLTLTCALMLLNTDLHGQHVGKVMSSSKFVSNLDRMNEGENFSKDLLKGLYTAIKTEPLQWAVDEEELKNTVLLDDDTKKDAPLRNKSNPFQDVPHDSKALMVRQGFLKRKVHADIDGKRTPWGKRRWKTFYGVLRGMVLYLQKNEYRSAAQSNEEVMSVHHSLAEPAADYTKRPHVFRLQTADWRIFLFQASSKAEMNLWINRINLVSALQSSPPFPAAVGSQRRFCRPILPASQSAHTLERQLQSHTGMLQSFEADLTYLQESVPEGRRAKAKELEEQRVREEYLQHEITRYQAYIKVLLSWQSVKETDEIVLSAEALRCFDKAVSVEEGLAEETPLLKRSYSSPSLDLEIAAPTLIKVKRNISERRTYRKTIGHRWKKEV